jgi:hypothetical protein
MRVRQSIVKEKNLGALSTMKKGGPRAMPKIEPGMSSSNGITSGNSSSSSSSGGGSSSVIDRDSNSSTMNENGSSSINAMQIETNENNAIFSDDILPPQTSTLNSSSITVGAGKESHLAAMQSALEVGLVGSGLNDEINRYIHSI